MNIFEEICRMKKAGETGVLVVVVDKTGDGPSAVEKKLLVERSGQTYGTVGGGDLEQMALLKARELIEEKKSFLQSYDFANRPESQDSISLNMVCGGKVTLYFEYIAAVPTAYIFGMGHVGRNLSALLKKLDYNLVLVDDRESIGIDDYENENVYFGDYSEIIRNLDFAEESYIVVCSYSHEIEYQVLKALYEKEAAARYLGLLASKNKAEHILGKLEQELGYQPDLSKLYAPIGLDIGGKSPEEVALSIASELQAVRYGRLGNKHLTLQWA
jgi:xanthine dehydrogenase accessory factor